jgi:TonB family protein
MSILMGSAGLAAKKSPLLNYYRWEEPYTDITVCLKLEAVNRLQAKVLDAVGSVPDAGNEVGGILLGRKELLDGRTVTVVEDFELVACERQGPLYSLTSADLVKLRGVLAKHRSDPSPAGSVIGYFRSHIRDDLFLSAEDLSVIRGCFSNPDNIFLLVKALPGRACTAGFFFWENGKIQPEFTDSEVALIPIGLRSYPPEADGPAELPPLPAAPQPSSGRGRRWVLGGLGLLALAAAGIFALVTSHKTAPAPRLESPRVAVAENLPVSPPTAAPAEPAAVDEAVPKSAAAVPEKQKVPLPENALTPMAAPEQRKTEPAAVRPPPIVNSNDGRQNQPKLAPESVASLPQVVSNPPATPLTSPAASPAPAQAQPNAVGPNPAGAKVTPPPVVEAPKVAENAPPALDQQRPAALAPVAPASPAPLTQTGPSAQSVETRFVGPQITHRVAPAIPAGVRTKITTDVQIDVTVAIDENGKVASARVTSQSGAAAGLLALEALKAAQLFRFQPAQENNRHVRSDMVLTFRFTARAQ